MAECDPLTGLPNRRSLQEHLERMRRSGTQAHVLVLDLDDFKLINDRWGHQAGDEFLTAFAGALQRAAPEGAFCSRLGGDEFCLVIDEPAGVERFCDAARQITIEGLAFSTSTYHPGCSIGVASFEPAAPQAAADALRRADLAMYAAKAQRGGGAMVFAPAMQQAATRRAAIMQALPAACRGEQMFLEYQPIVSAQTSAVEAVEALVRWNHPTLGRVEPSTFIGLAEHSGDIQRMGEWILSQACADLGSMPPHVVMNINLSARQISNSGFPQMAAQVVARHGLSPQRIVFEMTETINPAGPRVSDEVASLRDCGFGLLIDDFGTQYAFIDLLRSRLFDGVKLPRDLIVGAGRPGGGTGGEQVILNHLARMCRELGLGVVAEGVETEDELAAVRAAGIPQVQGYHFAMPMRLLTALQALWPAPDKGGPAPPPARPSQAWR